MNIDLTCGHETMLYCGCTKCAYERGVAEAFKRELCGATIAADMSEEIRKAKATEAIQAIKDKSYAKGFNEAREKAAKIAFNKECSIARGTEACGCANEIDDEIRALNPEGERG